MPQIINTNIPSLNSQRNLNASQSSLNSSIQRLSSGLRVNSAKDDAAGLAIAERMSTQIRGMTVAERNANDGISFAQTAEGALSTVTKNLQRMRELAVQAANGPNGTADRKTLNDEYKQLSEEVFRLLNSANFNGQQLFTGTGAAKTAGVSSDFAHMSASQTISFQIGANVQDNRLVDQVTMSLSDIANDKRIADVVGVTSRGIIGLGSLATVEAAEATFGSAKTALDDLFASAGTMSQTQVAASAVTLQRAIDSAKLALDAAVAAPGAQSDAQHAIKSLDLAINLVTVKRAEFGAVQTRFEAIITNLQVNIENLTASKSRIMDADFAAETANLTRAQILQQAGVSMLAQANSQPQNVLGLLGG